MFVFVFVLFGGAVRVDQKVDDCGRSPLPPPLQVLIFTIDDEDISDKRLLLALCPCCLSLSRWKSRTFTLLSALVPHSYNPLDDEMKLFLANANAT